MKRIESGTFTDDGRKILVLSYSLFDGLDESECPWPSCVACKAAIDRDLHFAVYVKADEYRAFCSVPCAQPSILSAEAV